MLHYLPLESYKNRYTYQLSRAMLGWMENNWRKAEVPYTRYDPYLVPGREVDSDEIKTGRVLDACRRSVYAMEQVTMLLMAAEAGQIKDSDVIYFEDMFHPGIEAVFYTFAQLGLSPRFYTYCWAQSVDQYDFTFPMRRWMRSYEKMVGRCVSGIFVANTLLKELLVEADVAEEAKVHVVGLPFDSQEVLSRMPKWIQHKTPLGGMHSRSGRKDQVVFSSRWDTEKNPDFFCEVARQVLKVRPDVTFVVCTSAKEIRSNSSELLGFLNIMRKDFPDNFLVKEGLSKEDYYKVLADSKVQFNCADQDWVSFTLLEASVAGCYPIYPYFRSFPETLNDYWAFMYPHKSVPNAVDYVYNLLTKENDHLWKWENIDTRSWVHKRMDGTWFRMLMKMIPDCPISVKHFTPDQLEAFSRPPYAHVSGRPKR